MNFIRYLKKAYSRRSLAGGSLFTYSIAIEETMMNIKVIAPLLVAAAIMAQADGRVGVCAHVTRDEFNNRIRTYEMMQDAGFDYVRSDFDWHHCQKAKNGPFDFSRYDQVVDDAAKYGIKVLPIFHGVPGWAQPVNEHLTEWRAFIRESARHFKGRIPVVEIWNEANISAFWKDPNPEKYAEVLKVAYEEVKAVDPTVLVAFGGTAGCAYDFIEATIKAGAKDAFDIVNVHPYRHPNPPEPGLTEDLKNLKQMMARNGIADRPIWITEMGWPTHRARVPETPVLKAGLKIARPDQKAWRAVYVDLGIPGTAATEFARSLQEILPAGSTCTVCSAEKLNARLPRGEIDLVVFPFGERYPDDAIDAVVDFVKKGGALVLFGGYPLYYPMRGGQYAGSSEHGAREGAAARNRLRIGVEAWWDNKAMPQSTQTFPSDEASAAGLKCDPAGLSADRFFSARLLQPGDQMVPLLVGKDKSGGPAVGAAAYLFGSDMKGRVIVSSRGRSVGTSDESQQAKYTVDAIKSAFANGVERYFIYEFLAVEKDPYYSEHHFGIVHKDFSPKPAYWACREYVTGKKRGDIEGDKQTFETGGNPILPGWYADPQIRRYGKTYWIFPTMSLPFEQQVAMDAFSSPDLKVWTKHTRILTTNEVTWARGCLWAPDAHEKDGKYYLFFGANDAYPVGGRREDGEPQPEPGISKYGGIGVAVADRPEGPYRDLIGKPLIDRFWNGAQPIDQYVFRYKDEWYMIYGGWGRCNLVKLAPDFKSLQPLDDGRIWRDITPQDYVEGSVMFERKGVWYFMYSSGSWTKDSYCVNYSVSSSPFGPFEFKGRILDSQRPLATGAGHHSVINIPGTDDWYICYHRRPIPSLSAHHRVVCLDRMYFNDKGDIIPVRMSGTPQ